MADVNSDKNSVYNNIVIVAMKKMSTTLLTQTYNHNISQ
jgi:hypothetical protein